MTVTVLVESRSDCVAFSKAVEKMMEEGDDEDISYTFRIDGMDVLTRCHAVPAE